MAKILVIGSPGTGKSTFARVLSRKTQLPLISLDDLYWRKHWQRMEDHLWIKKLEKIVNQKTWIIEGNYANSLELRLKNADLVIFLHAPTFKCLYRVFKRGLDRWRGKKESLPIQIRNDMTYQPSLSFDLAFTKLILFFNIKTKRTMEKLIKQYNCNIIHLREKEKKAWLENYHVYNQKIS